MEIFDNIKKTASDVKKKVLKLLKKYSGDAEGVSVSANHYLTGKEIRAIAKANAQEMRRLEREKNR